MGRHDSAIQHLRESIADALDSLATIGQGQRRFVNGEDITPWWITKYIQIVESSANLIRGYEKHND